MSVQLLTNAIIIVAVVAWIGYRQLTWRVVAPAQMLRLPVILGVIGVVTLVGQTKVQLLNTADIASILIELVLSLGIGALMGAIAVFRPMTPEAIAAYHGAQAARGRTGAPVTMETRTGWWGMALWVVLIAARVGIDVIATAMGSQLAASTGLILIMVAANRLARVGVITARYEKLRNTQSSIPTVVR